MAHEELILDKLTEIANKLDEQNLLQKTVLNFNEACKYLDVSPSHLYKLTSTKHIPHFCPQGKKLYFKREELDTWLQRNRKSATGTVKFLNMVLDAIVLFVIQLGKNYFLRLLRIT